MLQDFQDFSISKLYKLLANNVEGYRGPCTFLRFAEGQSNPTYQVSTTWANYVLRKKPTGQLLPSAHAVDREFKVQIALHTSGDPVPSMRLYCDDDSIIGTPFYLMDQVEGRVFWDPTLPELSAPERAAA